MMEAGMANKNSFIQLLHALSKISIILNFLLSSTTITLIITLTLTLTLTLTQNLYVDNKRQIDD